MGAGFARIRAATQATAMMIIIVVEPSSTLATGSTWSPVFTRVIEYTILVQVH